MPEPTPVTVDLEREGAVLARYLLGRLGPQGPELPGACLAAAAGRYALACTRLFPDPAPGRDAALLRFTCRHPRGLPCLDAAAGLLLPRSMLRQRLILMLAILETMPELSELFLPQARSRSLVVAGLLRTGGAVAFKTLGGILLLPIAQWAQWAQWARSSRWGR